MLSQEEKQRRKTIQNKLAEESNALKLAELPMSKDKLALFFNYLDEQLTEHGCDHTLGFTKRFTLDHKLPFESIELWLSKYGGYCDCEILLNVEDHFENL